MEKNFWTHLKESVRVPLYFLGVLWLIHISFELFGGEKAFYGIFPREIWGMTGILTAPLVHGSWMHLISNSAPFFFLTLLLFFFYRRIAVQSFILIYLLTGITVWIFARSVFHIGASGVVYGLVSFIFWSGLFRRDIRAIILALIVTVLYSGMFLGILPNQPGISWESHLLGAIVGIFIAFVFRKKKDLGNEWEEEYERKRVEEDALPAYFLPPDVFEKTKQERLEEAFWEDFNKRNDWISDSTN